MKALTAVPIQVALNRAVRKALGPKMSREGVLQLFPVGTTLTYSRSKNRTGDVMDASECGDFVLLERHDVMAGEKDRIAVYRSYFKEVAQA